MKNIRQIGKFLKNICYIIKIVFQAAPGITTKMIICNIFLGILVSFNVYIWKYFVDTAVISLESGKIGAPAFWLISLAVCTGVVNLLTKLSTYYREIGQEYMNCKVANIIMGKIDELYMTSERSFSGTLITDASSMDADQILEEMYSGITNKEKYSKEDLTSIADKGMRIAEIFMKNARETKELFEESLKGL